MSDQQSADTLSAVIAEMDEVLDFVQEDVKELEAKIESWHKRLSGLASAVPTGMHANVLALTLDEQKRLRAEVERITKAHQALRVAAMVAVSVPEFGLPNPTWSDVRAQLASALSDDLASAVPRPDDGGPIPLNDQQLQAAKEWAADDRLWTTQEAVEFNLRTFARVILKAVRPDDQQRAEALEGLIEKAQQRADFIAACGDQPCQVCKSAIAALQMHLRDAAATIEAALRAPESPTSSEARPECRRCGGSGWIAEKRSIEDGWGEVDSCPDCEPTNG